MININIDRQNLKSHMSIMRKILFITTLLSCVLANFTYGEMFSEKVNSTRYHAIRKQAASKSLIVKRKGIGTRRNRYGPDSHGITPYISVEEKYDDNIFHVRDADHDFITTVTPGIKLGNQAMTEGKFGIYFDSGANLVKYARRPEFDSVNPYARCVFGTKTLNFNYSVERRQSPRSEIEETGEEDIVQSWNQKGGVSFSKQFGKITLNSDYSHSITRYDDEEDKDSNTDRGDISVEAIYDFSAGARRGHRSGVARERYLITRYERSMVRYPKQEDADIDYDKVWGGFGGRIFPKVTGKAMFGYGWAHTEGDDDNDDSGDGFFLYNTSLVYDITENLAFTAGTSRNVSESSISGRGRSETNSYNVGFNYAPPFNEKITIRGGASYSHTDYSGRRTAGLSEERKDKTYGLNCSIDYRFKENLVFSGGYKYTKRESDVGNQSYINNVVTAKLNMEF